MEKGLLGDARYTAKLLNRELNTEELTKILEKCVEEDELSYARYTAKLLIS